MDKGIITSCLCTLSSVFVIPAVVFAASFDCGKATSEVEKLICEDQELSKSDEALAALYAKALKHVADPLLLKRQQRAWLGNVRDQCPDASSLREAYAKRIKELSLLRKTASCREIKTTESYTKTCQIVVDHANRGVLEELSAPPHPTPREEELKRIFGEDADLFHMNGGLSYWRLDLNNDGIPDHLLIVVDGTAHVGRGYVLSGKKGSVVSEFDDEGYYDLDVLKVNGRYTVLSSYQDWYARRLGNLWRLAKDGEFVRVCGFAPRDKPETELFVGKENAVCAEARLGRVYHVTYSLRHKIDTLPPEDRFQMKIPIDGLAQADIDNDGRPDNIVRLNVISGGRSCDATFIAVTDESGANIPDSKLNHLLLEEIGGSVCGPNLDVFVHKGVTYVDAQDDVGNRTIYRIKGDKIETICQFRGHRIYDVVDVVEESER
jgi:uncharacterized protein YecT (DUF1311 family)